MPSSPAVAGKVSIAIAKHGTDPDANVVRKMMRTKNGLT
jgi:hypothetical protein